MSSEEWEEDPVVAVYRDIGILPPPRRRRKLDYEDPENAPGPSNSVELADTEVDNINGHEMSDDIEIVPVSSLAAHNSNGDSDERYDTGSGGSLDGVPVTQPLPVPFTRVFSPEGTEFVTPANSPPNVLDLHVVPSSGDEMDGATEASELARVMGAQPVYAEHPTDRSRFGREDLDLAEASDLKRFKPYLAKATEEDELRKIQALEEEIMSAKSQSETEERPEDHYSGDSLDYQRPIIDVTLTNDDVMFRPPSVPSVEYHDDTPTPVPGNFRDRESGSENERRSTNSQGSKGSRPDSVPQLVLATAVVKTDDECSNDEGEADDEDTHRSEDETPVPQQQDLSAILFPDLSSDILSTGRDPCDDIMNRIDSQLLVINEKIERAHSPERFKGQQRVSSPYGMSPSSLRRSPTKRASPSPPSTYLKNQRSKPAQPSHYDDPMSTRTEDFADQFQNTIIPTPKSTDRILAKLQKLQDTLNDLRRPGATSTGEAENKAGPSRVSEGNQARSAEPRLPKPPSGRDKQIESDLESVQTEDFLREYKKTMIPAAERRKAGESDAESVKTEEFERMYRGFLLNTQKNMLQNELEREKRADATAQRPPQAPRKYREILKAYKKRGYESASELDTARTDDMDYQSGKHVAGVNLECFDDILVDSDVDTVKSAQVRNKFRNAMAHSKTRIYTPSEVSEEDVADKQYRDYIARKLTEISRLPRIDASASDIEKQEDEDDQHDYEEESDAVTEDQLQQRREVVTPQYDHLRHRRRYLPSQPWDDYQGLLRQVSQQSDLTNTSGSTTRTDSLDHSTSLESSQGSKGSTDLSVALDLDGLIQSKLVPFGTQWMDSYDRPARVKHRTSTTSKSTFEEVESLDLNGSRDSEFSRGLSSKKARDLIQPDSTLEEIPFAQHVFNKRKDKSSKNPKIKEIAKRNLIGRLADVGHFVSQESIDSTISSTGSSSLSGLGGYMTDFDIGQFSAQSSRRTSLESSNSSMSSPMNNMLDMEGMFMEDFGAEGVLGNLGFGVSGQNFLPDRFVRDWKDKVRRSREEKMHMLQQARMAELLEKQALIQQIKHLQRVQQNRPHVMPQNNNKLFKRSATFQAFNVNQTAARNDNLDQLRDILTMQNDLVEDRTKRVQFASSRQKSLPVYLDTLSEEEGSTRGDQRSRSPSLDKIVAHQEEMKSDESPPSQCSSSYDSDTMSRYDWSAIDIGGERPTTHRPFVVDKTPPKRLPDQSSTSLEVADILDIRPRRRRSLILEPAVVTTVLQDMDGRLRDGRNADDLHATLHLPVRRPSETGSLSPSSTSPFPLSPITVIECENLDNQNDSFDDQGSGSNTDMPDPVTLRRPSISIIVEGASDSECVMDDTRDGSMTDDLYCPIRPQPDSGRTSPVPFHNQYPTSSKLVTPSSRSSFETFSDSSRDVSELESEDSSCSKKEEEESNVASFSISLNEALDSLEMTKQSSHEQHISHTEVQADDGRLSPLDLLPSADDYYDVCDRASQYDYPTRSISTQTDGEGAPFLWRHDAKCQVDLSSKLTDNSSEPTQTSTQTDHGRGGLHYVNEYDLSTARANACCHCHQENGSVNQTIEALSHALIRAMDRLVNAREGPIVLEMPEADLVSPREEMENRNKALNSSISELVDQMDCRMSNLDSLVDEIDSQVDRMDRLVDEIDSVNMEDLDGLDSESDVDDVVSNEAVVEVVGTMVELTRNNAVEMEEIEKSLLLTDEDSETTLARPLQGQSNGPAYVDDETVPSLDPPEYLESGDESRKNALNRWGILSQKVHLSRDESVVLESVSLTGVGTVNFHNDDPEDYHVTAENVNDVNTDSVKVEDIKPHPKSVSFNSDPEINHYEVPRRMSLIRQNASEDQQIERMSSCDLSSTSPTSGSFGRLGVSYDSGKFSLMKDTISETEDLPNGVLDSNARLDLMEKTEVQRPTRLANSLDLDFGSRRTRALRFHSLRSRVGQRNVLKKMHNVEDDTFSSIDESKPFHISFEIDSEGRRIPALRRDATTESMDDSGTSRDGDTLFLMKTTNKQATVIRRAFSSDLGDVQEHQEELHSPEEQERTTPPPNIPSGIFAHVMGVDESTKDEILQEIALDYEKDSIPSQDPVQENLTTGFYRRIKVQHRSPWSSSEVSDADNVFESERREHHNDIIEHCRKKIAMSFHRVFSTTVDDSDEGLPDGNTTRVDNGQDSDHISSVSCRDRFLQDVATCTSDMELFDAELADIAEVSLESHSDTKPEEVPNGQVNIHVDVVGDDGFYDQDDLTSQDEEVKHNTLEIHLESRRIAREMEDERRKLILQKQQQQARVAKSLERMPMKATEPYKAKSPERRQAPLRAARSLDRLSRSPPKSPEVRRPERIQVERIEKAVFAKEIKEKLVELQVLADTVDEAKTEKRVLINELRGLRDAYNDSQNEIKLANMHSRDYTSKADELKTELTLLEYKRSQTQQELDDTEKNLATKKQRMEELDQHIKENLERLKDFEELGMSADQVKRIMSEKDKLKSEVGKQEAVGQERDLLKEKLLQTKEELYEAEKRNRAKIEILEDKVDALVKQTQELQTDKSYLQQQLRMLEDTHHKAMEEKDIIIKEKEQDYDSLHRNLQAELNDLRQEALVDTSRLKQEVEGLQVRTMSLQEDVDEKSEENTKLRDQILDLQCDLSRETDIREKESLTHKDQITKLEVDKDASNTDIRQRLYAEKQNELQEAYDLFEQERRELAAKQESKLSEQLAHHHQELIARDEENQMLREQVRIAEDNARTAVDKAQREATCQLETDLESERRKWESERDRVWKLELAKISGESVRAVQQAREDAEREKDICQHLEGQIEIIKQELEEQRQANRQAYKDKLDSIGRLKETAREERENAADRARARAIEEGNREIERLRLLLETKDEEIKRMRGEAEHVQQREADNHNQWEKHDKTIIHEINDDCKKTALLLGVTPRKAVSGPKRQRDASPTRSAVNAALANLRACNEQLRSYVMELKHEIDNQRSVMVNIQREKEDALCCQKEKLITEKTAEMDMLRERLIKDHMEELVRLQERSPDKAMKQALIDKDAELREIQRNMNIWKEEVAEKFAKKFEEELNRELEKRTRDIKRNLREKERTLAQQQRDIERLEREVTRLTATSSNNHDDSETIKLLRHLQNRVKELRTENNQLKRNTVLTSAALDLGTDSIKNCYDFPNRTLENRIKQAELRAELAEDRAARNEQLLNSKISEISRLQGALTHQTKEVMQLERAYKSLQSTSPIKR